MPVQELNVQLLANTFALLRQTLGSRLDSKGRDYDKECGYPYSLTVEDYDKMFEREGLARRVVKVEAEDSWKVFPEVYEDEDPQIKTPFEEVWETLEKGMNLFSIMSRVDVLSGLGRYGIILFGFGDGQDLSMEVQKRKGMQLLYARVFDESVISISTMESNVQSERYGLPLIYKVTFEGENDKVDKPIHYSRVLHVCDNKRMSEVYGSPRMESVYNRLCDIRKVLAGSSEMFWQGGFPGLSLETLPGVDATLDTDSIREQLYAYTQGLQRYIALENMKVNSLTPQVSDPSKHLEAQIDYICITLGIPKRIFVGSERGELASSQDVVTWNNKLMHRQGTYITPYIIRPFIDKLIEYGALPEPKEYEVEWPDLNTVTDDEKAGIAEKKTNALAKYVAGSVENIMAPMDYLTLVMGFTKEEAESIIDSQIESEAELEVEEVEGKESEVKVEEIES